jgi:hypothetical protein
MLKIGVLLEVIGFFMASFFIVLLKIDVFKRLADKLKDVIIRLSKKDTSSMMVNTIVRLMMAVVIGSMWSKKVMITAVENWRENHFGKREYWQYPILFIPIFLQICQAVYITLLGVSLIVFDRFVGVLAFISNKLTGKEAVTNLMIIVGTIILFVGLILQLIHVWSL